MLRQRTSRRWIGVVLVALGIAMMVFAPESRGGLVVLGLAIALEFAGLALERKR